MGFKRPQVRFLSLRPFWHQTYWFGADFLGGFCVLKNSLICKSSILFLSLSFGLMGFCRAENCNLNQSKKVSETLPDNYSGESDSKNSFFSLMSRMRYIKRWQLSKNSEDENLESHSFEVAVISHALAVIKNEKFKGHVDENKAAVWGLFHDVLEIITGDAPTPVKYFDPEMKKMYTKLEQKASNEMLEKIEDEGIRERYSEIITSSADSEVVSEDDEELRSIVKSADNLSALIKCLRERRNGNNDFDRAYYQILDKVKSNENPEVKYFVENYLPSYCC